MSAGMVCRAAAVIVVLVLAPALPGAVSMVRGEPAFAAAPAASAQLAPVMVVLDASGSMTADAPGGVNKMQAARQAVGTLVGRAPQGARLGLTVYGSGTGNSPAEKARGCQDVSVVQQVGTDVQAVARAVQGVRPSGYTPIGRSLQVAANALPQEGPRSIVLVSDGEDTCAPPEPCEVARQLARAGVDMRVHTVGFDADDSTRRQLSCIAEATGGTYSDAPDAGELDAALNRTTQRALRNYVPTGTPVTGSATPGQAPALGRGSYLDRLDAEQGKYYSVDLPAGHTGYVTASVVLPLGHRERLRIQRLTVDGSACRWTQNLKDAAGFVGTTHHTWTAEAEGERASACERPGRYVLRVERRGGPGPDENVDNAALELLVGVEPPLEGPPGPEADGPVSFTEPGGEPRQVTGGGSFSTAGTLGGSGTYTDTVRHGEAVFYRVRVGWGQGLAYRVDLPDRPGGESTIVRATTYNPMRHDLGWEQDVYREDALSLPENEDAVAFPQVRYRNREGSSSLARHHVAGWYYIAIGNGRERDEEPTVPAQVTLRVAVVGDEEPGPRYAGGASDPFGGAGAARPDGPPQGADDEEGPLSLVSDAGPALWIGAPLLLAGGVALISLLLIRARRPR